MFWPPWGGYFSNLIDRSNPGILLRLLLALPLTPLKPKTLAKKFESTLAVHKQFNGRLGGFVGESKGLLALSGSRRGEMGSQRGPISLYLFFFSLFFSSFKQIIFRYLFIFYN